MEPWELEIVRRSTVMLSRGQKTPLTREQVLELIEELQLLQARHQRAEILIGQLRTMLARFDSE